MNCKYQLNSESYKFKDFLLNIKTHFNANSHTIHKARNELKIINFADTDTVVKSFKVPHLINRVIYSFFKSSKAKKSYNYSLKISDFTPKAIGYIEFYSSLLIQESYFISEKFDYDFTIREPLLENDFPDREEVFRAFARFTLKLHNEHIYHDDYSPGNILIKKESDGFSFKIVDINRMKFFNLDEDTRAKNFSKLWASNEILVTMAEEYKKHHICSESFVTRVLYYSNQNKKVKNFKKRLKGQEVND